MSKVRIGRKVGEQITLIDADGQEVTVTISSVNGQKVVLNVEAPLDVRVWRGEPPVCLVPAASLECGQDASQ